MAVLGKYTRSLEALHVSMESAQPMADLPDSHHIAPGKSYLLRYFFRALVGLFTLIFWKAYRERANVRSPEPQDDLPANEDISLEIIHSHGPNGDLPIGEDISLGKTAIGKASLQCNFIQSESAWGRLGNQRAGVLYFSMTINQKSDIKIKWAEFDVRFRMYKDGTQAPAVLPMVLEPKSFTGQEILVDASKKRVLDPQAKVGFGGANADLRIGQMEGSENMSKRFYWTLTAFGDTEENSSRITRAVWEWQANEKAPQASTKTLQGGAVVVSVIKGDFEIELRLRCQLKSRTQRFRPWVRKRLGFGKQDIPPMIREVHSSVLERDLEPMARNLKESIRLYNEDQQLQE